MATVKSFVNELQARVYPTDCCMVRVVRSANAESAYELAVYQLTPKGFVKLDGLSVSSPDLTDICGMGYQVKDAFRGPHAINFVLPRPIPSVSKEMRYCPDDVVDKVITVDVESKLKRQAISFVAQTIREQLVVPTGRYYASIGLCHGRNGYRMDLFRDEKEQQVTYCFAGDTLPEACVFARFVDSLFQIAKFPHVDCKTHLL